MKFTIIPNKQTPIVDEIDNIELFMIQNIQKLIAFKEYAETKNDAIGLAANQCAIDDERFMIKAFALRDLKTHKWRLIINPNITEYVGIKEMKGERCLTWKDKVIVAERSRGIWVKYYNEAGKSQYEFHKGFEGQIWQHEINHLNGIKEDVRDDFNEPPSIEVGRNDPCPCLNGKKYKKCCLLLK